MQGAFLQAPRDIRFEERPEPKILQPTHAIIRLTVISVCGSDLWPCRGIQPIAEPSAMAHEYCGIVEEVSEVKAVKKGQFVVRSFCICDNTCPNCRAGYLFGCQHLEFMTGAQVPYARVPHVDGTLVGTREKPSDETHSQPSGCIRMFSEPAGSPPMQRT
jgi:threonine dehydrogenase-like Zn-dependent dehydrogenase